MTMPHPTPVDAPADRKPRDDEIDVFGLTHAGKVRSANQDHFLICSLRRQINVHSTSLPASSHWPATERLAFLAMVADGVGSSAQGGEASRLALEGITEYVTQSMKAYYASDSVDDAGFSAALQQAAMQVHKRVVEQAKTDPGGRSMATTLTLFLGVWPRAYLLQLGDSRCYLFREGTLTQITRDQTMAQELVDQGVLTRTEAPRTRWAHVLSSAIGGHQTAPVVTRVESVWNQVILLCSDGLTKHVPDERIAERLRAMTSAKQVCEALLEDALADGGSDNITIIVGRAVKKDAT
ncbi:MAG TPA: protein phosphatase 2C domain-containing protein [Gemmatimonadales bacterium]|jgi:serine/threonine protein phosphatase PrpC|nr:protein phosphatase 2C domain-containing protein [Gemmatimonadales bacterium]